MREKMKYAGLRNGKIVEFANDKLSLNHDHIDQIIEIELDNPTGSWNHALYWDGTKWVDSWGEKQ